MHTAQAEPAAGPRPHLSLEARLSWLSICSTLTARRAHLSTTPNQGAYFSAGTDRRYLQAAERVQREHWKRKDAAKSSKDVAEEVWVRAHASPAGTSTRTRSQPWVSPGHVGADGDEQHVGAKVNHPLPDLAQVHAHARGVGSSGRAGATSGAGAAGAGRAAGTRPARAICQIRREHVHQK